MIALATGFVGLTAIGLGVYYLSLSSASAACLTSALTSGVALITTGGEEDANRDFWSASNKIQILVSMAFLPITFMYSLPALETFFGLTVSSCILSLIYLVIHRDFYFPSASQTTTEEQTNPITIETSSQQTNEAVQETTDSSNLPTEEEVAGLD